MAYCVPFIVHIVEGSANNPAVTCATESVMGRLGWDSSSANSDCENLSLHTAIIH